MSEELQIRAAGKGDERLILTLLHELAEYEELVGIFSLTEAILVRDFFGSPPICACQLAFVEGATVGLATWYWTYSSFRSLRGIYLEDLYVREKWRGRGFGKSLLAHLAKTAQQDGGGYVKWSVLDWNKSSIDFYESLGAKAVAGWTDYQLDGASLTKLANG